MTLRRLLTRCMPVALAWSAAAQDIADSIPADTSSAPVATVPAGARLKVLSDPQGAKLTINDVALGTTPFDRTGFQPGLYDLRIDLDGYDRFTRSVELSENAVEIVEALLRYQYGRLAVNSTPPGATVYLNRTKAGTTPYYSPRVLPGQHSVRIELDGHGSVERLFTVARDGYDTMAVHLLTRAHIDSVNARTRGATLLATRVIAGLASVGFAGLGYSTNRHLRDQVTQEASALAAYRESSLPQEQYDARWSAYVTAADKVDRLKSERNTYYVLAAILAGGLGITLFF